MQRFYTVSEVAKMLRVRKELIYQKIHSGQLNAIKISTCRLRIPEKSLEEFLAMYATAGKEKQATGSN